MNTVKEITSETLLNTIEQVFTNAGIPAVIKFIETEFGVGTLVHLNQDVANEKIYTICNYAIWQLDTQGRVLNNAYLPLKDNVQNCNLIRVLALSYISQPFQVELYGTALTT
jgi:hypothetical protein